MKRTALIFACMAIAACMPDYSDGVRVGVIQKGSYKGILNKSFEGEIVMSGIKRQSAQSSAMTNVFHFSATDSKVIEGLNSALDSGNEVKITYRQWLVKPPSQDTPYTVTNVDTINL